MQILNLSGYGINVHVDGGRLVVKDGNAYDKEPQEQRYRKNTINFDKLVITGKSGNITIPAIRWLMKQKRDIAILDWNGRLLASFASHIANLGEVKLAQYRASEDPQKKIKIAKWLIKQKIEGGLKVLVWMEKNYPDFKGDDEIEKLVRDLEKAPNLTRVNRAEASASWIYWKALISTFDKKWEFVGRNSTTNKSSRDADDPINALLNYGYAVLESECWKIVNTVGLEPYIGFIHKTYLNKAPLIYDLQEPFRWLVEMAILKIMHEKKVKKTDFLTTDEGNVMLKPSAVKIVLEEIAKQFGAKTFYKGMMREWQTMIMIKTRELTHMF